MSHRVRVVLSLLGFIAVAAIVTSDRFQGFTDAVPEALYYSLFVVPLILIVVVGYYSWWQRLNGRQVNSTVARLKEQIEKPTWWNWPF